MCVIFSSSGSLRMRLISQFSRASGARFSETDDSPETVVGRWILPAKLKALLGSSTILSQVVVGKDFMVESKSPLFGIAPMEASRGVPQKTSKCKCSLTPRCSESFHRAHAMRGNARKILPSTAVRSSNWRASGPLTSGAALAASSWRIWCRALASNNRAASLKEPSDVARIPNRR